jgi:hypothetical protein
MKPTIGRLHVITDTTLQNRYSHAELAELAIRGGADTIQYRSKSTEMRRMILEAGEVREICNYHRVTFIVNDRVDLCQAVGADGVHLGHDDMPIARARTVLGPERIIGGTIRNRADLGDSPATSQADLLLAIEKERRLELAQEGHRWDDLKRSGRAVQTMTDLDEIDLRTNTAKNYNMAEFKLLLPIPQPERSRNLNLGQNDGYN